MKVFISYSSHDDVAVRSLAADLERARHQVWLDQDLGGGDAWWAEILKQIRECAVFVIALSGNSLRSMPCQAERDYATRLGLPILPVQIGEVSSYRTDPIFSMQIVDYRDTTKNNVIDLVAALHERASGRTELPDPLPEPPPIPFEYLQRLGAAINGAAALSPEAQAAMVFELRTALEDEIDDSVVNDIRGLLRALRGRRDVTYAIVREIDSILDRVDGPKQSAEPEVVPPKTRPEEHLSGTATQRGGEISPEWTPTPPPPEKQDSARDLTPPPPRGGMTDQRIPAAPGRKRRAGLWLGVAAVAVAVTIGTIVGITQSGRKESGATGTTHASASPTRTPVTPTNADANQKINASQVGDCVYADPTSGGGYFGGTTTACEPGAYQDEYWVVTKRTSDINDCSSDESAVQASDTKLILCLRPKFGGSPYATTTY